MAEFHFIRPLWLLSLLPYSALLWLAFKNKLGQGDWTGVCDAELLPYILERRAGKTSRGPAVCVAAAAFLAIVALAGPTWERLPSPAFRNDAALVILLDLSRSMDAADVKPSRLVRARYKIADMLKRRKDGQTALAVYAADAFTVAPLTDDVETINSQLSALTTAIMPAQGSNVSAALEKAVALLKQAGLQQGDILLVTDGVDPNGARDIVEKLDPYRLSVLAAGTGDGAPIKSPQGGFLKDAKGDIVIPKLDEAALRSLATAGGGIYQELTANDGDVEKLSGFFSRSAAETAEREGDLLLDRWDEKGPWLLLIVIPLAALAFRRGIFCLALLALLPMPENAHALTWDDLWRTADQQAQQDFEQERYDRAAEKFGDPAWKAAAQYKAGQYEKALETLKEADGADAWYNKGNAYARTGRLKEALEAYRKALEIDPDNEDAKYNKELIEKELEKQQQQRQPGQDGQQQPEQDRQNPSDREQGGESDENGEDQSGERQEPESGQEGSPDKQQEMEQEQEKGGGPQPEEKDADQQTAEQMQDAEDGGEESATAQEPLPEPSDETQQAGEQWLKRIPDDPAGLLRRKFKYQYGQKPRRSESLEKW
ncbi:MAG: VWA domain-containing protein [Gammaproteobacteria bacterium]